MNNRYIIIFHKKKLFSIVSYISRNEITTIDNSIGNLFNLTTS